MTDFVIVSAFIVIFTVVFVGMMVFSTKKIQTNTRYEHYKTELKTQGKYEDWKSNNSKLLLVWKISHYYIIAFGIYFSLSIIFFLITKPISQPINGWLFIFLIASLIAKPIAKNRLHKTVPMDRN